MRRNSTHTHASVIARGNHRQSSLYPKPLVVCPSLRSSHGSAPPRSTLLSLCKRGPCVFHVGIISTRFMTPWDRWDNSDQNGRKSLAPNSGGEFWIWYDCTYDRTQTKLHTLYYLKSRTRTVQPPKISNPTHMNQDHCSECAALHPPAQETREWTEHECS